MATTRYRMLVTQEGDEELGLPAELPLDSEFVYFENSGTGLSSDNMQSAILESSGVIISVPRYPLKAEHHNAMINGQLVGLSHFVNAPLVIPVDSVLKEITFIQTGGNDRDGQYRFYKNSETPNELFFTWNLPNTESATAENLTDYTSPSFSKGDTLNIYFDNIGNKNHKNLAIVCFFQATN